MGGRLVWGTERELAGVAGEDGWAWGCGWRQGHFSLPTCPLPASTSSQPLLPGMPMPTLPHHATARPRLQGGAQEAICGEGQVGGAGSQEAAARRLRRRRGLHPAPIEFGRCCLLTCCVKELTDLVLWYHREDMKPPAGSPGFGRQTTPAVCTLWRCQKVSESDRSLVDYAHRVAPIPGHPLCSC